MLTSLEIENFKGIASRQRIDFAPVTLLFGANSAGKSTILQALMYLHEVVERGSADVDHTELGGQVLELGGFARLVHRHDLARSIVLRAEFDTPGSLERLGRDLTHFPLPDLEDEIDSAWLELTIRGGVVERASIGANGDTRPLVVLSLPANLRDGEPIEAEIHLKHPLLESHADVLREQWATVATGLGVDVVNLSGDLISSRSIELESEYRLSFALAPRRRSALPPLSEPLRVVADDSLGQGEEAPQASALAEVRAFLEMVVLGTTTQLATSLRDSLYIGPLRAIPPRGYLYERVGRTGSWADGLAAWDLLLSDRQNRVEKTNEWLGSRRLDAGCQVTVQQLYARGIDAEAVSQSHVDGTVRRLLLDVGSGTPVLPSEVGAGISQVVPVIVAALDPRPGMTLIEQPELHIHPRLQTKLGDLFIVASARRQFLIETHSEHLILRALRRIRETSAGELEEGDPPFTPDKLSVIYVEANATGTSFKRLRVDETGEFVDRWPNGFFEERAKELF
jgi:hypothetical protein